MPDSQVILYSLGQHLTRTQKLEEANVTTVYGIVWRGEKKLAGDQSLRRKRLRLNLANILVTLSSTKAISSL